MTMGQIRSTDHEVRASCRQSCLTRITTRAANSMCKDGVDGAIAGSRTVVRSATRDEMSADPHVHPMKADIVPLLSYPGTCF